jgi:hypothetical protein
MKNTLYSKRNYNQPKKDPAVSGGVNQRNTRRNTMTEKT